jgi:hypothetical protein
VSPADDDQKKTPGAMKAPLKGELLKMLPEEDNRDVDNTKLTSKEIKVEIGPINTKPAEGREESKQTEPMVKRTEEENAKEGEMDISLTSITDPKNMLSSMRDAAKALNVSGSSPQDSKPDLQRPSDTAEPPSNQLNSSVVSDINASRLDERPLIIDVGNNKRSAVDVTKNTAVSGIAADPMKTPIKTNDMLAREKFLRKGSKIGLEGQEQVIRNYLKQGADDKKEAKQGEKEEKKDAAPPPKDKKGTIQTTTLGPLRPVPSRC